MIQPLLDRLGDEDDDALWQVALDHILSELEKKLGTVIEVGRCSHWLRPHQTRWTADGGFAWPTGYGSGNGGHSRSALPQFDWSVFLEWTGDNWIATKRTAEQTAIRITVPSRTTRHQQAAIHTIWRTGKNKERRFYGFRKKDGVWKWTAETQWVEGHRRGG
jgi:hypothetical protein